MYAVARAGDFRDLGRPSPSGAVLRLAHDSRSVGDVASGTDLAKVMEFEVRAAALCLPQLRQLAAEHPLWMDQYDDADPNVCSPEQLWDLLESAPTEFARGLIYGKLSLRTDAAAVTGRF